jgi:hypothetical protein
MTTKKCEKEIPKKSPTTTDSPTKDNDADSFSQEELGSVSSGANVLG